MGSDGLVYDGLSFILPSLLITKIFISLLLFKLIIWSVYIFSKRRIDDNLYLLYENEELEWGEDNDSIDLGTLFKINVVVDKTNGP